MMEHLLFSFSVYPLNPAVNSMLIRIVTLILQHVYHLGTTYTFVCRNIGDTDNRIGVFLSLRSSCDNKCEKEVEIQLIEHGFLGILQELLANTAAASALRYSLPRNRLPARPALPAVNHRRLHGGERADSI